MINASIVNTAPQSIFNIKTHQIMRRGKDHIKNSIYKPLLKKGLTKKECAELCHKYAVKYVARFRTFDTVGKFHYNCISANFHKFLQLVTEETNLTFSLRPKRYSEKNWTPETNHDFGYPNEYWEK